MARAEAKARKVLVPLQAAIAAHGAGRLKDAERLYRKVLHADPGQCEALHGLGTVLHQTGANDQALGFLERALRAGAGAAAEGNRASVLMALKRHPDAVAALDRALAANPNDAGLHYNRGNALLAMSRNTDAEAAFATATTIQPGFVQAHLNRGIALSRLDRFEDALTVFDHVLALDPANADAASEQGGALLKLNRRDAALGVLDRLVAGAPRRADAHFNRGFALLASNRHAEALAACERALALEPEMHGAHFNAAVASLAMGDYARGWADYEWRWRDPDSNVFQRGFTTPRWTGAEDLTGRTLLLHAEQGMGDAIQFVRFVPVIAGRAARIIVEAPAPLVALFRDVPGMDACVAAGSPLPPHDLQTALMSLPAILGTRVDTIPAAVPYLRADPARIADWQQWLGPRTGLRVGLAWSGNPAFKGDQQRSAPLAALSSLAAEGTELIAIQKDVRPGDLEQAAEMGLRLTSDRLTDFAETAALACCLDLVISVDSAPAHLAGALGRPLWVMLPWACDWRWLIARTDSPWYPTARLFRQAQAGDWASVVSAMRAALPVIRAPARDAAQPAHGAPAR